MKLIATFLIAFITLISAQAQTVNHSSWNKLLQEFVTDDGRVNYKGLSKKQNELQQYIDLLSKNVPNNSWSKNETLVYWINAYNALTVDLILKNYPLKSIKDIKDPWKQKLWTLGGKKYNLDEIEHSILRKMNEPRIHFAIVCASYSCPKLLNKAFTTTNLDQQLTQVTKGFLADTNRNTITANDIKLSKLFKWFESDFKTSETNLIDFLNKYSKVKIDDNATKSFRSYDWSLNE